jgi:hypothetical protein
MMAEAGYDDSKQMEMDEFVTFFTMYWTSRAGDRGSG